MGNLLNNYLWLLIIFPIIIQQAFYMVYTAENSDILDQLLEEDVDKILSKKFGISNINDDKISKSDHNSTASSVNSVSLMEMVKNIMNESGVLNPISNENSSDTLSSFTQSNGKIPMKIDKTNSTNDDIHNNINQLKDVLKSFIKSTIVNKIDETKKQLSDSIIKSLEETITQKPNNTKKIKPKCVDVYKECIELKNNGVCKSLKSLMMKNCKKTCGFCNKNIATNRIKPKIKPRILKQSVKKPQVKKPKTKIKSITTVQHLKKSHNCRLHCKKKCTKDCPKYCCASKPKLINKITTTKRCNGRCPDECAPDCSKECCFESFKPKNNVPHLNYPDNKLNTYNEICFNDYNCPKFCYPQCVPECCYPDRQQETNPVDILTQSFMKNFNAASTPINNNYLDTPMPIEQTTALPIDYNVCTPLCSQLGCENYKCPPMCCFPSEQQLATTMNPAVVPKEIIANGLDSNNSTEINLNDCPTNCIYKCTDSCYRNQCCDKK